MLFKLFLLAKRIGKRYDGFMSASEKKLIVKCPTCRKPAAWKNNKYRPFCCERCRLIDLGNWADESYNIESENPTDFEEEI